MPLSHDHDGELARSIRRGMRRIAFSIVVMYIVVAGLALWNWHVAQTTERKLCTFTSELADRIQRSVEYLEMTPSERIEKFGSELGTIDEGVIEAQIQSQTQMLADLGGPC